MRRFFPILMLILALCLTACGGSDAPMEITRNPAATEAPTVPAADTPEADSGDEETALNLVFTTGDVTLVPGDPFDASVLPEPESTYEVPSCAIVGTDNVYNYGGFEITAFKDASGETIYSIYFLDPNVTTPEGLALGDPAEKALTLYGDGYEVTGTQHTYTSGTTLLCLIIQNDTVVSIEYRLKT